MKQRNASKGAECRHPVRQRHAAILAMYEAKATKQLSSAIVISSSRFALFCFFRASSLSKAPAAAAVDHAAAAITPTERQGRVCRCVRRTRRLSSPEETIVAPSVTRQHTPGKARTRQCKYILAEHFASTYVCWVCDGKAKKKRRRTGRHISTARGTAGWQRYMRCGPNLNNHARWQHTHKQKKRKEEQKKKKTTRRQGLAVCVWRCGCLPALAAKKQNKRERNVCSAPQALVARPHVTAPSARRSSRPLLMRAAGEAHRAVVMSVSVGVRVEQLGGKHTAPLTGRVQKKQLKEGRVEKKKTSILIAPKSKKEKRWGVKD
ncbi:hypothetical protein ECC02_009361 [Trypanosoma cruzi]|uniref:Uncharacterized protein n=1 Tax=Trypanosoma cruzi TaxID=5693 RepID=A0A7J6XV35_TRYCR|nr:hypothetical protein ECC02_009361 [Trypanosoma cruzi]